MYQQSSREMLFEPFSYTPDPSFEAPPPPYLSFAALAQHDSYRDQPSSLSSPWIGPPKRMIDGFANHTFNFEHMHSLHPVGQFSYNGNMSPDSEATQEDFPWSSPPASHMLPYANHPSIVLDGVVPSDLHTSPFEIPCQPHYSAGTLHTKSSYESIGSSSGRSEYLLTPQRMEPSLHFIAEDATSWGELSEMNYDSQWEIDSHFGVDKQSYDSANQQIWDSVIDDSSLFPVLKQGRAMDYTQMPKSVDSYSTPFRMSRPLDHPPTQKRPQLAPLRRFSAGPTVRAIPRQLSSAFDRPHTAEPEQLSARYITRHSTMLSPLAPRPNHLLPSAAIVANQPGWESTSPTYSSLAEFDLAAQRSLTEAQTLPVLSARPGFTDESSIFANLQARPPISERRTSRPSMEIRRSSQIKTLFAFHPVDISTPAHKLRTDWDLPTPSIRSSTPTAIPRRPSGLRVDMSAASFPPMQVQSTASADRQASQISCPLSAPSCGPTFSHTNALPYKSQRRMTLDTTEQRPSLLSSNSDFVTIPQAIDLDDIICTGYRSNRSEFITTPVMLPLEAPAIGIHNQADITDDIHCVTANQPLSFQPRPIAALPMKRKVSARVKQAEKSGQVSFDSFINFTPRDAVMLQAAVAPSGLKSKRRMEEDYDVPSKKRVRRTS